MSAEQRILNYKLAKQWASALLNISVILYGSLPDDSTAEGKLAKIDKILCQFPSHENRKWFIEKLQELDEEEKNG